VYIALIDYVYIALIDYVYIALIDYVYIALIDYVYIALIAYMFVSTVTLFDFYDLYSVFVCILRFCIRNVYSVFEYNGYPTGYLPFHIAIKITYLV